MTIAALWQPLLQKAARAYIAGSELHDALRLAETFAARGVTASTLCFWDPEGADPNLVAERYLATIRAIAQARLDSYISIKAPSLAFDGELVTRIAVTAKALNILLHFDSLGEETAGRTFDLIAQARNRGAAVGCSIPGRWRRSPADAARVAETGVRVRVVKGQWDDPRTPIDPAAGFLQVVDALAGTAGTVAVATHDPRLARQAIGKLRNAGTPSELELLHGLPSRGVLAVARELDIPVRYYLPYGHAWLPYALRQARRNPRILWWALRDAIRN